MDKEIVIDCPSCSTRVSAAVSGVVHNGENDSAVVLAKCPACGGALLGFSDVYQDQNEEWRYTHAARLWPAPSTVELSLSIPESARRDIKDAQKCISHNIFSASVVLCGRALERLAKEKAPSKTLAQGLSELKAQGVIDERLYQWATALRNERNLGAHAAEDEVTRENAQDVLAFTIAIFEYVYTLSEKYQEFMARKANKK